MDKRTLIVQQLLKTASKISSKQSIYGSVPIEKALEVVTLKDLHTLQNVPLYTLAIENGNILLQPEIKHIVTRLDTTYSHSFGSAYFTIRWLIHELHAFGFEPIQIQTQSQPVSSNEKNESSQ
jgi:hypothetical protein